jgi:hypothetical protein
VNYLLQRLREPSTWAGLAAIMGTAAHAVAGVVAVIAPDPATKPGSTAPRRF